MSKLSFSDRRVMIRELKRIRFVMRTQGTKECIRFCSQGLVQYTRSLTTGYGKAAGFIRNQQMAQLADGLLAFWDRRSRGTKHLIETMRGMGKPVCVIDY